MVSPFLQCEIPKWFSYQGFGPLLSIDMSPNWHDNSWRGFAICASFKRINCSSCQDLENAHFIFCGFYADGNQLGPLFKFPIRFVNSNCLWLGYVLGTQFPRDTNWDTMSNHIAVSFTITNPGLKIKECGVHLVYENCIRDFDNLLVWWCSSSPRDWDRIYHELQTPREVNCALRYSIDPDLYEVNEGVMSCGVSEVRSHPLNGGRLLMEYLYVIWHRSRLGQLSVHDFKRSCLKARQTWSAFIDVGND